MTTAQLKKIFTTATATTLSDLAKAFNNNFKKFDMNRCLRKAHFFAQVRKEVGPDGKPKRESMNYPPARLKSKFGYFARHPKEANLYGRTNKHRAQQKAIANRAYGNRIGNGNVASGDGWKYRGGGFIQLTGRANWKSVQKEIDKRYPKSGVDIKKDPDSTEKPKAGMLSGMGFWSSKGLNQKADEGAQKRHVNAVSRIVNPGEKPKKGHENAKSNGWVRRWKHFKTTKKVFKVASCTRRRNSKGKCVTAAAGPAAKGKGKAGGKSEAAGAGKTSGKNKAKK